MLWSKWKIVLLCMAFWLFLNVVDGKPKGGGGGGRGGGGGGRGGGGRGGGGGGGRKAAAVGAGVVVGAAAGVAGAVVVHDILQPPTLLPPVVVAGQPPPISPPPPPPPPPCSPPPEPPQGSPNPGVVPPMSNTPPAAPSAPLQLSLTVYYDAMELNSQFVFNTTLVKEFGSVSSIVDVIFMPCQLATDKNGDLTCPTQADPSCSLNKVHSCAIAQVTDKTQLMNFLACTMNNVEKLPDFMACASQNKMDGQKLQNCATSDEGKNLCKDHSTKKIPNCDILPGFVFKKPDEARDIATFEHLDNYISDVCASDLQAAVCAELKVNKATGIPQECDKKLVIGIFYKAMDEKSQKWFQTFATMYEKFSNSLTVKYEPCMFAELSSTGDLDCKDQADTGCVAAKTHVCAVTFIPDPKLLFQFLSCTMKDATKMPDFGKCATDNKIPYEPIKACAESDMGKQLCFDYSKARPKTDKIPAFSYELTFDDASSEETSAAANLKNTFCQQMSKYGITQPPECAAP